MVHPVIRTFSVWVSTFPESTKVKIDLGGDPTAAARQWLDWYEPSPKPGEYVSLCVQEMGLPGVYRLGFRWEPVKGEPLNSRITAAWRFVGKVL